MGFSQALASATKGPGATAPKFVPCPQKSLPPEMWLAMSLVFLNTGTNFFR